MQGSLTGADSRWTVASARTTANGAQNTTNMTKLYALASISE